MNLTTNLLRGFRRLLIPRTRRQVPKKTNQNIVDIVVSNETQKFIATDTDDPYQFLDALSQIDFSIRKKMLSNLDNSNSQPRYLKSNNDSEADQVIASKWFRK